MKRPSKSPITMHFGSTDPPYTPQTPHMGCDFAYIPDDQIYAPVDGAAIVKLNNGNDGNAVYIRDGQFLHGLLHMAHFKVTNGQQVKAGQVIGIMGDTGKAEGVHLHHALKLNDEFVNPENYYDKEEDMVLSTATEVSLLWQLNGINRDPTEEEVKQALGRELTEYVAYLLSTQPFKDNLARVKYYPDDVKNASNTDPQLAKDAENFRKLKQLILGQ